MSNTISQLGHQGLHSVLGSLEIKVSSKLSDHTESLPLLIRVKSLALHFRARSCAPVAEQHAVTLLPVRPAPAAPNRDAMTAIPAVEPKAAAPALPITVAAPAATRGAARPPVKPEEGTSEITGLVPCKKNKQSFRCAVWVLLILLRV